MSAPPGDSGDTLPRESVAVLPYSTVERQLDRANQRWLGMVTAGALIFGFGLILHFIAAGASFAMFTIGDFVLPWRIAELAGQSSPMVLAAAAWLLASTARDSWDATHMQLSRLTRVAAVCVAAAEFWLATTADVVGGSPAAQVSCGLFGAALVAFSGMMMANLAARIPHRIIDRHLKIATAIMATTTVGLTATMWLPVLGAPTPRIGPREPLAIILGVATCAASAYLAVFVFRLRLALGAIERFDETAAGGER